MVFTTEGQAEIIQLLKLINQTLLEMKQQEKEYWDTWKKRKEKEIGLTL